MEYITLQYGMEEIYMEEIYINLLYVAVRKSEQHFIIKMYVKSSVECIHDFYIKNDDMDKLIQELVKVRDDIKGKVVINDSESDSYIIFDLDNNNVRMDVSISNNKFIKYVKMSEFIGYESFKEVCNLVKSSWKYEEVTDTYDFEIRNVVEGEGVYVKVKFIGRDMEPEQYYDDDIYTIITVEGIVSFEKPISMWWLQLKSAYSDLVLFIEKEIQSCSLCNTYDLSEVKFIRNNDGTINTELVTGEDYDNSKCEISVVVEEDFVLGLTKSIGEFIEIHKSYRSE